MLNVIGSSPGTLLIPISIITWKSSFLNLCLAVFILLNSLSKCLLDYMYPNSVNKLHRYKTYVILQWSGRTIYGWPVNIDSVDIIGYNRIVHTGQDLGQYCSTVPKYCFKSYLGALGFTIWYYCMSILVKQILLFWLFLLKKDSGDNSVTVDCVAGLMYVHFYYLSRNLLMTPDWIIVDCFRSVHLSVHMYNL